MGIQDITNIFCGLCLIPDQDQPHDQETTQSSSSNQHTSSQYPKSPHLFHENEQTRTHFSCRRSAVSDISTFANSPPLINLVPGAPLQQTTRATPDISITEPTPRSSQDDSQSRSSVVFDNASHQQTRPSDHQPNTSRYSGLHGLNTYVPFWDSVKHEECKATRRAPVAAAVEGLSSRSRYRRRENMTRAREYAQVKSSESMIHLLPGQRDVLKSSAGSGCVKERWERVPRGSTPVGVRQAMRTDSVFAAINGTNGGVATKESTGHGKDKERVVDNGGCGKLPCPYTEKPTS